MDNYTRGFLREEDLAPSQSRVENFLRLFSPVRIANSLAPVAHDENGNYELALPSAIADPIASWKGMVDRHRAGIQDDAADARDAFNVGGVAGVGSLAAAPFKPSNALGTFGRGMASKELPMDLASRMARAKEMGFDTDTPVYHGRYRNFDEFDPNRTAYFSEDPEYASVYTNPSASSIGASGNKFKGELTPNVIKAYLKKEDLFDTRNPEHQKLYYDEFNSKWGNNTGLTERGLPDWTDAEPFRQFVQETNQPFKGIIIDEGGVPMPDGSVKSRGLSYAMFEPKNIRSVNAVFDPAKSDSANLLAANPTSSAFIPFAFRNDQNQNALAY